MQKIFFLSGNFPPQTGGEFYNYKVYEYLRKSSQKSDIEVEYVNLHQLRFILKLSWIPVIGDIFASLLFTVLLLRCQGLLIIDHYFSYYLTLTKIINRLFQGQLILIVHHSDKYCSQNKFSFLNLVNKIKEKISLSFADRIITVSEYTKKEITSLGVRTEIIEVLPPALDRDKLKGVKNIDQKFDNLYIHSTDSFQVLCVGHCIPRKGIIHLIEAFAQVKAQKKAQQKAQKQELKQEQTQEEIQKQEFTLHIVGKTDKDTVYYSKVKNKIEELSLQQDIYLHERVNQQTLNQLYSTANIFVLPSLQEGFGIVFLEAMYYSLPIIATNISAIPELVKDGENGLLVPPENSQSLAAALLLLIENSQLREKMGQQGKAFVDTSYFWEQTNSKFLSVVESLDNELKGKS